LEEWRLRERVSKDPLVLGDRFSMYSGPMVRVLAGVWRELTEPSKLREKGASVPDAIGRDEVVEYFQKLDVLMELKQPLDERAARPRSRSAARSDLPRRDDPPARAYPRRVGAQGPPEAPGRRSGPDR
jgi:hypothetical protein